MTETIHGTVKRLYFSSPIFSAGVVSTDDGREIRFIGKFQTTADEELTLTGNWAVHQKYGRQFMVNNLQYDIPQTQDGLIRYLAKCPAFKGIGEVAVKNLAQYAGTAEKLDRLLRCNISQLCLASGIPLPVLTNLREQWIIREQENQARSYFASFELTPNQIDNLLGIYGDEIINALKKDPYAVLLNTPGYGFKKVDKIALKFGILKDHPGRIRAALKYLVGKEIRSGHTWIDRNTLYYITLALLKFDSKNNPACINENLDSLLEKGDLVAKGEAITFTKIRDDERLIYEIFSEHHKQKRMLIPYDPQLTQGLLTGQIAAFNLAVSSRIAVITGAAGTGKSLIISRIARAFSQQYMTVEVCAPTGKAAKRAEELMRQYGLYVEAKTIHRLLGYNGVSFDDEILEADILIVDEVSMVSVDLMAQLLRCIDFSRTSLILVGDHNQLPSVGPGSILRDIIWHGLLPVARLTEVVRQAGVLKTNSNAILEGQIAQTDPAGREWVVLEQYSKTEDIQQYLCKILQSEIPKFLGYDPLRDVQILSPTHKGALGTRCINQMIQKLNHGSVKGRFTVGDRVVQKVNDYDLNIFNGSLGRITAIEKTGIQVLFDLEGEKWIPQQKSSALHLAYCLTIHSMQGSEAPCVILLLDSSHRYACRQLVYTGVTRARRTLIILGDKLGIRHAIGNTRSQKRRSLLSLWAQQTHTLSLAV